MRRTLIAAALLFAACSREKPAPPAASSPTPATTTTATATVPPQAKQASYEDAMAWFASANAFHFVVDEAGVHAEGDLTRPRIGQESIQFQANGRKWTAQAGPQGVTWKPSQPPFGGRLWQRVTVAFDPQKIEGTAQRAGEENGATHFRFTDANTGEVHEVWVRDNRVERMQIDDKFSMTVRP